MPTLVGGGLLLLLSLFMLAGFLRSSAELSSLSTMIAVLVTVVLPAGGGIALLNRHFRQGKRLADRKDRLRLQTLEAEILRLAAQRGARVTVVEIVTEMAIPTELAQQALDALVQRELADIAVSESGMVVYEFRDIRHLSEKSQAKGVLE